MGAKSTRMIARMWENSTKIAVAAALLVPLPMSAAAPPNGIEVRSGHLAIRVVALRDDILRVRVSPNGKFGPDHSWVVLPEMSGGSVRVQSIPGGFATSALRVSVNRKTLQLVISDTNGRVLLEDSRPPAFRGESFRIYKASPQDEHYYGLGDKSGPLDRRGTAFEMWNTDAYGWQESTDPLYKSIPFFLALREGVSYGLFLNNPWRSSFDFNKEDRAAISFGADGGDADYYFLYGPDPKQVITHFTDLVGRTPLPPRWSLGFQQSRYSYYPESRVREIAGAYRQKRIPVDVIYLDIDYQLKNRPFTVDPERFPAFGQMIKDLGAQGIHAIAITDLHIAKAPDSGYKPYDTGLAGDHFVKNPDGTVYTGNVWPGPSVFPEFTRKVTRDWWGGLYREFYVDDGIAGFWNDMNEPAIFEAPGKTMPLDTVHRIDEPGQPVRSTTHREIHNVYGMLNARATYEGLLQLAPDHGRSCSPGPRLPGGSAGLPLGQATTAARGIICASASRSCSTWESADTRWWAPISAATKAAPCRIC